MIKSITDLSDMELRIAVLGRTGHSIRRMALCLNITTYQVRKIQASINKKCGKSNFDDSIDYMAGMDII